jgi:DNA-binding NarL/FixJ family response regulator
MMADLNVIEDEADETVSCNSSIAPLRLFLVEDSKDVRDFIVADIANIRGLQLIGFAETENDAFNQLREHECDVLILDIELKQGNGINLLRTISRYGVLPRMLKIIFSNNISSMYRRIGAQFGVQFFFDKTTQFMQLRDLLKEISAGRR